MAFLAPLFLAGLAALALPVLLHLQKNRPRQVIPFSTLMFLEATPPVARRRSRLQDILLLLLRCLGLALLVAAFARPFFPAKEPAAGSGSASLQVVLIDTSASHQGKPLADSLAAAREVIEGLPQGDWIAVASYSDRLRTLLDPARARELSPGERKPAALTLLEAVKSDWNAAKPDAALLAAVAMAADAAADGTPVKLHVFSDFKKGSSYERLRGEDWPDGLQVIPHPVVRADGWTNAGLRVMPGDGAPRARVTNAEGSAKTDFILSWGGKVPPQPVSVAAGETALIDGPEGLGEEGTVELAGDDYPFDNRASWARPVRPKAKIRYLGAGDARDTTESLFFLSRAMQPTPSYDVEVNPPSGTADLTVASGGLPEPEIARLRETLQAGGNVLLTLRDVESAATLGAVLDVPGEAPREAVVKDFALLGAIDFDSEVFSPFADPRYSDFSAIRFWKYRVLPESRVASAAVLARFDSGDPAWLRYQVGKGALHVLATTWRPVDSQLALSPKFPPLLHALLARSPALAVRPGQYLIGQPVPMPEGADAVVLPDGSRAAVESGQTFSGASVPGIYHVGTGAFAVQIDPMESEILPLEESELRALGLPLDERVKSTESAQANELSQAAQESRQRIGWWLLIAAVAVFLIETAWAATAGSRPTPAAA